MEQEKDFVPITKIIQEVCDEMCDKYCKMPDVYGGLYHDPDVAQEKMMADWCEKCPLNRLQ